MPYMGDSLKGVYRGLYKAQGLGFRICIILRILGPFLGIDYITNPYISIKSLHEL